MAAVLDQVRFALPCIGLLAGGAAVIGGAFYAVTVAIGRIVDRTDRWAPRG